MIQGKTTWDGYYTNNVGSVITEHDIYSVITKKAHNIASNSIP